MGGWQNDRARDLHLLRGGMVGDGMTKVDLFIPYHDGSMQHDVDGGWVSYDDYKEAIIATETP